jgi:hypothetical protein
MALVKFIVVSFITAATVLGSPYPAAELSHEEIEDLVARQENWATQYWANENANLDWNSGRGGAFDLSWDQPNGGNFVVGKGVDPARPMYVPLCRRMPSSIKYNPPPVTIIYETLFKSICSRFSTGCSITRAPGSWAVRRR